MKIPQQCPLCKSTANHFYEWKNKIHYQCPTCGGIFKETDTWPSVDDELKHYEQHNNDIEDTGYQNFVSPITNAILNDLSPKHEGLDFGAGPGPVISKVLNDNNFSIVQYDPYFHNFPELLTKKYDYIVSCEVIEHFYHPHKEFALLKKLLKPNGKLYCMTHIYDDRIDFHTWYYKNDPTHVFIYQAQTFDWLRKEFGFSDISINNRLIIFSV